LELKDILRLLRRSWWLIIICAILAGGAAYYFTPDPTPVYAATTTVLLSQGSQELPDVATITRGETLAATYGELMRSRPLLMKVIENLGLQTSPDALSAQLNVSTQQGTNLLDITVRDTDPQRAADIANEIVNVFISENMNTQMGRYSASMEELQAEISQILLDLEDVHISVYQLGVEISDMEKRLDDLDTIEEDYGSLTALQEAEREQIEADLGEKLFQQNLEQVQLDRLQTRYDTLLESVENVRILAAQSSDVLTVVETALYGQLVTTQPKKALNAAQGAGAGAFAAFGIAFLINYFRASVVESSETIEKQIGVPTLGVIAEIKGSQLTEKLVTERQPRSPIAEAYRVLRTNLDFSAGDKPIKTMLVTSSSPVEGKTTTAANLAVAIAQSGKRVILVDTDLRRPAIHKLFEQSNTRGVTTALLEEGGGGIGDHVLATGINNLYLMPSGPLPPNPADLLGSSRMAELIRDLARHSDMVIFDSPPLFAVADATLLAGVCDAVLLVAHAQTTRVDVLKKATEQIMQSGANLLGVVLNRASLSGDGYSQYYYYRYY
jgi:capsular exopolysaccharide synthesis family protein